MADFEALTEEQFKQVRSLAECGTRKAILPYEYILKIENQDHLRV